MDLIHADQADPGSATPQTASITSVMLALRDRQAEEPGELDREHPRGRGGRDGDVDDRDPGAPGWRSRSIASWVLPNWVIAVVLPVPAAPDRIRPRRALMACRFSRASRRPVFTTCRSVEVATAASRVW